MSSTKPAHAESVTPPATEAGSDLSHEHWGVKQAENLIASLTGVTSVRLVATPMGKISEIHVLTTGQVKPKQVVRNVESALMAQLDLKVDHRKISVAQTADVRSIDELQTEAEKALARHRAVIFRHMEVRPGQKPHRIEIVVRLRKRDREAEATEKGMDTPKNRVETAARATAAALEQLYDDHTVALEGAKLVNAFEKCFVLVAVHWLSGRDARLLTGTCEVTEAPERSAVLAVLDATNRWADARR